MEGSNGGSRRFRTRSRSRRRMGSSVSARLQPDFDPRDHVRNSQDLGQNTLKPRDSDEELDPKTMDFSTLVQCLHSSFIYDHLQKILHFLKSDKLEISFPNIAPYKETFLVKIANDNQRLMCALLNDASREVGRQILTEIEQNRNVYRWIHMYESGRVTKNVLVYKKMYYNDRKISTATTSSASEFKTPGPMPATTKSLSSRFESLELTNKIDGSRFNFDIPSKANPCTTKDLSCTLPHTAKDPRNKPPQDHIPTLKTIQNPTPRTMKVLKTGSDPSPKKHLIIPTNLKISFLNSTIKFLKDDNQLTLEVPQMTGEQAEYFASVIDQIDTQQKNVTFGFRSLYAPLYTALEELHGKYELKTILNETYSDNVRMVLRKIPKGNPNPNDFRQSMKSVPPEPSTEFMTKAQKELLMRQKTVNSVSENFIKISLQRILDFMDDDARASLLFDDINLEESNFLQMAFTLSRNQEYYKLFNEDCVILLKKIFRVERYETQHRKQWKINTQVGKLHKVSRLGYVTFDKVPTGGKKPQLSSQIVSVHKQSSTLVDRSRDVCDSRSHTVSTDSGRSRDASRERSVPDIAQRLMELSTRCESTASLEQSQERLGLGFASGHQKDERDTLNRSLSKDRSNSAQRSGSKSRRKLSKERHRKLSKERRQPTKYNIAFQSAGEQIIDCVTVNVNTCRDGDLKPQQFGRKKKLMDDLSTPVDIDKAKRMMMGMGWDGGPLGARGDGIIEPIMPAIHLVSGAGLGHIKQVSRSTTDFRVTLLKTILTFVTGPNQETSISFTQPLTKREIRFVKPTMQAFNNRSPIGLSSEEMELVKQILENMLRQPLLMIQCEILNQHREIRLYKTEGNSKGKKRKKRSTLSLIDTSTPSLFSNSNCDDADVITTDQILNLDLPVDDYSHKAYKNLACKVTFMQKIKEFLLSGDEKKEYACDFILNNKQREYIHLLVTLMNQRDGKYKKFGTRIENQLYNDIRRSVNNCFVTVIFSGQKFVLHKRVYQKRFTNSSIDKPLVSKDEENTVIYENNTVRRAFDKPTDRDSKIERSDSERDRNNPKTKKKVNRKVKEEVGDESGTSSNIIANEKLDDDKNEISCDIDDSDFLTLSDRDDILIIDDTDLDDFESDSESDKSDKSGSKDSKDSADEYDDLESDCDELQDISDESMLLDMLDKENNSLCIDTDLNSLEKCINDDHGSRNTSKTDSIGRSSVNSVSKHNLKYLTPYMESHTPPHDMKLDSFDVECGVNDGLKIMDSEVIKEENKDNNKVYKDCESDEELSLTPPLAELKVLKVKKIQEASKGNSVEKRKESLIPASTTKKDKADLNKEAKAKTLYERDKKLKVNADQEVATINKHQVITINNKKYLVLDKDQIDDDVDLEINEDNSSRTEIKKSDEIRDKKELRKEEIVCNITGIAVQKFLERLNENKKTAIDVIESKAEKKSLTKIDKSFIAKEVKTSNLNVKETFKTTTSKLETPQISTEEHSSTTPHDSKLNVVEDLYTDLDPPAHEHGKMNTEEATKINTAYNPKDIFIITKAEAKIHEVDSMEENGLYINKIRKKAKSDIEGNVPAENIREEILETMNKVDLIEENEASTNKVLEINDITIQAESPDMYMHEEDALSKVESTEISKETSQDSFKSESQLSEEYLTPGESIEKLNELEMDLDSVQIMNKSTTTLKELEETVELEIRLNKNFTSSENDGKSPNNDTLKEGEKMQPDIVVIDYKKVDGLISPTFRFYNDLEGYISELNIKKDNNTKESTKFVEDKENSEIPNSKEADSTDRQVSTNVLKLEVNNNGGNQTDSKLENVHSDSTVIVDNKDDSKLVETQCDSKVIVEDQGDLKMVENPNSYQNIDSNNFNSKSENLVLKRAISKDSLHIESSPSSSKRSRSDSENSDRISKKYKYVVPKRITIFPENLEKISVECVQVIQKCISENIEDSVILPLLDCNGIQNGGLIYTCYNDQTLIWLKKAINSSEFKFKIADTEFIEEKTFKLELKMNSFILESTEIILNRLELFNTGLNTALWEVLDRHVSEAFIVLIVKVDDESYQYICDNNFSLFAGVTKAQFSAIWD